MDRAATAAKELAPPKQAGLAVGFAEADLPVVATAAQLLGFLLGTVRPSESAASAADLDAEMKRRSATEGKPWAAAITGDAELIADYLDGLPSATIRLVSADKETLAELGIEAGDSDEYVASQLGYALTNARRRRRRPTEGRRVSGHASNAQGGARRTRRRGHRRSRSSGSVDPRPAAGPRAFWVRGGAAQHAGHYQSL
ncbi:MAG: hypothetical protein ACRD03_11675 [Acidimicrobiales bacterium]